jgi:hypothetical protein
MLLLAAGLLVLGVVLFVQKSVKAVVPIVLILIAMAAGAGAFALGDQRRHNHSSVSAGTAPSGLDISIVSPADGSTVEADDPVRIEVEVEGGELINATTSDNPRAGHLHIYIDGTLASMVSRSNTQVDMSTGTHEIKTEFTTADHRSFDPPITDTVSVTAE